MPTMKISTKCMSYFNL